MNKLPNNKQIEELESFNEPYCLTIYAPTLESNGGKDAGRIEIKKLIREAQKKLQSANVPAKFIKKSIGPLELLAEDYEFWPSQSEGLAVFVHPQILRYYHLPGNDIPYSIDMGSRFNVKPLKNIVSYNKQYFLLKLGHKYVHLYSGDRYNLNLVILKNMPTDEKQALNIDEYPSSRELHEVGSPFGGQPKESYHGQYNVSETDKPMLLEFFRLIDQRLHGLLYSEGRPLIISGTEYLLPIYKKANSYSGLVPVGIPGDFKNSQLDELKNRAWLLISR